MSITRRGFDWNRRLRWGVHCSIVRNMKRFAISTVVGLITILASSCANYYDEQPEGYVTQTVPVGYTMAVVAGISYWHYNNHYYRYWPGYGYVVVRPPHGRPPYQRPPSRPPNGGRPPGGGKPEHPIERPPGTRPPNGGGDRPGSGKPTTLPSTRPSSPSKPTVRPNVPTTRPSMPSTRPSMPSTQPSFQRGGGGGGGRSKGKR